jgi:hypothetical protein
LIILAGLEQAIHVVPPPTAGPITRQASRQTGETGARNTARLAGPNAIARRYSPNRNCMGVDGWAPRSPD